MIILQDVLHAMDQELTLEMLLWLLQIMMVTDNIESVRDEIAGLENLLRIWLPPVGIDSISYALIGQN
jgi:hypothetical protein